LKGLITISAALIAVVLWQGPAAALTVTLPEYELLSSEFASKAWGPASMTRTDIPGDAVEFDFTGLGDSGTGIKDDYPVNDIGQGSDPHNGDFSMFDSYALMFQNTSAIDSGRSGVYCRI